jgi:hypothetical protein
MKPFVPFWNPHLPREGNLARAGSENASVISISEKYKNHIKDFHKT